MGHPVFGGHNHRLSPLLDGFVDDRGANGPGLEQFGQHLSAFIADPLFERGFGGAEDGLATRQLHREFGVDRHGLWNLDDVDKRELWLENLTHRGECFNEPHISWSAIDRSENATSTISHE